MTVKPGYKQTEVGIIPKDWSTASIGELFLISAGGDFDPRKAVRGPFADSGE
jgi:type I restriction enzyme, S subunit